MKLIIDIPEEEYNTGQLIHYFGCYSDKLDLVIYNGIPLPEHHGRLGDLDALEKEIINGIKAGNYEEGYEKYQHINDIDDCVECVHYADTIIEGSESNDS